MPCRGGWSGQSLRELPGLFSCLQPLSSPPLDWGTLAAGRVISWRRGDGNAGVCAPPAPPPSPRGRTPQFPEAQSGVRANTL